VTAKKKRKGRPPKSPTGKRVQLTTIVRADIKRRLDLAADKSGRTLSQELELLIERLMIYEAAFERMHTDATEMEKGNVEAVLWRLGYTPIQPFKDGQPQAKEGGGYWKVWAEPGFPGIERSGFIP
jgi:hypothetical protein